MPKIHIGRRKVQTKDLEGLGLQQDAGGDRLRDR